MPNNEESSSRNNKGAKRRLRWHKARHSTQIITRGANSGLLHKNKCPRTCRALPHLKWLRQILLTLMPEERASSSHQQDLAPTNRYNKSVQGLQWRETQPHSSRLRVSLIKIWIVKRYSGNHDSTSSNRWTVQLPLVMTFLWGKGKKRPRLWTSSFPVLKTSHPITAAKNLSRSKNSVRLP